MNQSELTIEELKQKFEEPLVSELLAHPVNYLEEGQTLGEIGKDVNAIPFVLKGSVRVFLKDNKGNEILIYNVYPGESCIMAITSTLESSKANGQGRVNEPTEMLFISSELSQEWMRKYETWRQFVVHLYSMRLKDLLTQHEIVTEQKNEIAEKSESINSSIRYASRIQDAVLPSHSYMQKILPDFFVLNKPKDIVSGDFYWVGQKGNKLIVVAADSTGHGVPGAFMSMLGIMLLNEIVNKNECKSAGDILTELREKIKSSLKQTGERYEQKDGFDMALSLIDLEEKKIQFAGAYNPLYLIRKEKLTEIKADKMPVGIYVKETENFTTQETDLQSGDHLYMFSDGFIDQFGGERNQKFRSKPFKDLILSIKNKPLETQKAILSETFENWKGNNEQVDDVLIFGLKIN